MPSSPACLHRVQVDVDKPLGLKLGESTSAFGGVVVKVTLTVHTQHATLLQLERCCHCCHRQALLPPCVLPGAHGMRTCSPRLQQGAGCMLAQALVMDVGALHETPPH